MTAPVTVTTKTAYAKAWKKIAGKARQGINVLAEELALIESMSPESMPLGRENLIPVDLNEEVGVALIPEGGMEAEPSSVGLEEAFITPTQYNARFNVPLLVQYVDEGSSNQIEQQLKLQSKKKVEAIAAKIADDFHGSSSGVLALTNTDISGTSGTLTLTAGYGRTGITSPSFLAEKWKVGERGAVINGSSLLANSGFIVTSRDTTAGTITVTFEGTVAATTTDGLKLVKANAKAATSGRTIDQTDFNKGLVGMADVAHTSGALHSLTHENWVPAYSSSTATAFTGTKLRRGKDEIANQSGMTADTLMIAQGVYREMVAAERSNVQFDDPMGIEIDGSVKARGMTIWKSRRVPPGDVVLYAKKAYHKWDLFKSGTSPAYSDGKEYIDQNAMVFRLDQVLGLVCTNRKAFAAFTNQSEV